jgi:hypothetical protein
MLRNHPSSTLPSLMKLRLLAVLASAALLAGCEHRDPTLPPTGLADGWITPAQTVQPSFPSGPRPVRSWVHVVLGADGSFFREHRLVNVDEQPLLSAYELVEVGTYTAHDGKLSVHLTQAWYRGGGEGTNPVLSAVDGTAEYTYTVQGDALSLFPVCPPNALCAPPAFTQFIRYSPIAN